MLYNMSRSKDPRTKSHRSFEICHVYPTFKVNGSFEVFALSASQLFEMCCYRSRYQGQTKNYVP